MSLKTHVQWLLDHEYAVIVKDVITFTKKFTDEIGLKQAAVEIVEVKPLTNVVDKKQVWNEFIERAEIPHRVTTRDGSTYTVRQYNLPAVNRLIAIINDPEINYSMLIDSTKNYYKTVTYKILLSKYLLNDVWKDEYAHWVVNKGKTDVVDGSSRWES